MAIKHDVSFVREEYLLLEVEIYLSKIEIYAKVGCNIPPEEEKPWMLLSILKNTCFLRSLVNLSHLAYIVDT